MFCENLSKKLFMPNVNIPHLCPNGTLSFLYGIFLSHPEHFATITIQMESVLDVADKHYNLFILYNIYLKHTPLNNDGTAFAIATK